MLIESIDDATGTFRCEIGEFSQLPDVLPASSGPLSNSRPRT